MIPTIGSPDQIACNALQAVNVRTAATGTNFKGFLSIFITAIHATIAIVIDRPVTDIVFVHQIDNIHYGFGIVRSITIDLDIENMPTPRQFMVGCFDFGFVLGATLEVNRHMIGIGVILPIGYTFDYPELFLVFCRKFPGKALGRCCQDTEIVMIPLGKFSSENVP